MKKLKRKNTNFSYKISKYLPVVIILLSLTIILGSTFAYFTDKIDRTSELTFSKVELSGETTTGINGSLRDVIPGTPLVDGALKFSKSIDSEAIYVRAKISFSLPEAYKQDADMQELLDMLRAATDFNIEESEQHGAVWSAKDGNYFYLVSSADNTQLMRVDTIDTYTLSNEVVVPRDLESLDGNAQYMKSINFHIAFEAIQADNVSSVLSETKEIFNTLFPQSEVEKQLVRATFKGFDLATNLMIEQLEQGEVLNEPVVEIPLDENNEPKYVIDGWYTDSAYINKYEFGGVVEESVILYPLVYEVSQGLKFTEIKENGVVVAYGVSKGTCEDVNVVIPNTYNGCPVIQIDNYGFERVTTLESIYLPSSITRVGVQAFYGCASLILEKLPSGMVNLDSYAFYDCASITLSELPDGITTLGLQAFHGCENITLSELPSGITTLANNVFHGCKNITLNELPSGVTIIDNSAFSGCIKLALSELPSGVTSIGNYAFYNCPNITLSELPSGLTSIGDYTFESCDNLALTSLPSGITSIGTAAFRSCENITLTSLPSGITSIKDYAFQDCKNITLKSLPSGITSINVQTFYGCSNLALTSLPSGITSIGNFAFASCTNLALTSLPDGITSIGAAAFRSCENITLTSLPSGLTEIKNETFKYCSLLALTSLPSGITSIDTSAFDMCSYMTITSLPSGLTTIGNNAFYMAGSISLSTLPDSITSIGSNAFYGCISVTITSLPSSLVSLGDYAFASTGVNITELPSGVTTVGNYVFAYTNMEMLKLPSSLQTVSANAFKGNDNLFLVLCENQDVANLVKGKCIYDSYIYVLDNTGYAQGTSESTYVINSNVTVYTAYTDNYKWARINNEYYKCISAGIM